LVDPTRQTVWEIGRVRRFGLILTLVILVIIGSIVGYLIFSASKKASAPEQATKPPTHQESSAVDTTLAHMSLRDKVSSLLILHQPGTDPTVLSKFVVTYHPGGFIMMGDNIPANDVATQSLTATLRGHTAFPRLVATDEEGGTVKRLAADTFDSAETLKNLPVSDTTAAFTNRSNLLQRLGVTLNFGIIADTTADPHSFIYNRVLGTTPADAASRVAAAVQASKNKTLSTLKHFPGHGETEDNSHLMIPTITTSFSDWQQRDKPPFQAGINAGADVVMVGHLRYKNIDDAPASLSKKWHDILRNQLGFKGIIVTDDMFMLQDSGEPAYENLTKNAITALQAGNTMLLYVTNHEADNTKIDPNTIIDAIVAAVQSGQLSESTITNDAKLVLEAQQKTASF